MASKDVLHGVDARKALLDGALQAAKAVAVTYGPHGRTVMIDRAQGLISTRDGVTVAREIELEPPVQNLGAQILKEACVTVNDDVGDGTTTTAILAAELLSEGHKLVIAGFDPNQISRGMQDAAREAADFIESIATPVASQSALETVARLASNGDVEIASLLAEACMAVGKDGTVLIEDGHGLESTLELKEGMEIDRGAVSPVFLTGEKLERVLDGPLVTVINRDLRTVMDVQALLEVGSQFPGREVLVVALSVTGEALQMMALNNAKGIVKSCAVMPPGFGPHKADWLRDIAALAGASFVDPDAGFDISAFDAEWFGAFRQATIQSKKSTFIAYDDNHEDLEAYMQGLRTRERSSTSDYDKDRLKERLAKLAGGLAVVKVGGVTESAMKERRARVEDALGALRAALRGGIIPGAGSSFIAAGLGLTITEGSPDYLAGVRALKSALSKPLATLASNAGVEGAVIVGAVKDAMEGEQDDIGMWVGYDAISDTVRRLNTEPMIVNPALVDCSSLLAAASVASTMLTVEVSVSLTRKTDA